MPSIDQQTLTVLVDLLTPHMESAADRRAALRMALSDSIAGQRLYESINYEIPARQFVIEVERKLSTFGEITEGKQALWSLLEVIRTQVGHDKQALIDSLHDKINIPPTDTQIMRAIKPVNTREHVFISYSRANREFVEQFVADLQRQHIEVWIDKRGLVAGTPDWEQALRDAIRHARAVILIASPQSRSSRYVKDEISIAEMYQRPILPIWADGNEWMDSIPMGYGHTQAVDARGTRYNEGVSEIINRLGELHPTTQHKIPIPSNAEPRNPYKGLNAFTTQDAKDFFGREKLVNSLAESLQHAIEIDRRILAILGASGSGKSSVAMAGLLPHLQSKAPGNNWIYLDRMVPGAYPLENLAVVLSRQLDWTVESILENLRREPRGLHQIASVISARNGQKVVLFIDQFEELFTGYSGEEGSEELESRERERRHFIELLVTAVTERHGSLVVILTMRADFYDRPMNYRHLGELIEKHHRTVLPMEIEELRDVIVKPAELPDVQLMFDSGLVGDLLFEVRGEVGALPLLQFTLEQLFHHRKGHRLTIDAYREIGGVRGALARRAEETYAVLPSPEHRTLARTLFLRLIDPGITEQDTTRRRAALDELVLENTQRTRMLNEVKDIFVDARLLVTSTLASKDGEVSTIEVSHEALIREWGLLRDWLHDAREDIRFLQILSEDAREWYRRGENPQDDRLYRGTLLDEARRWLASNADTASLRERTFIETAEQFEQALLEADRQRLIREEETARQAAEYEKQAAEYEKQAAESKRQAAVLDKRRQLFQRVAMFSAGLGVIVALITVFAILQASAARREVREADAFVATAGTQVAVAGATLTPVSLTLEAGREAVDLANFQLLTATYVQGDAIQSAATAQTQAALAQAIVDGVQPTLDSAETQIAGVQPTLKGAETQVAGVQPTLAAAEAQVAAVNPTLTAVAVDLQRANILLDSANATLTPIAPTLTAVGNDLNSANLQVTSAAEQLNNSATQIAVAEIAAVTAQAVVDGVQPTLDSAQTQIAAVDPTLTAVSQELDGANLQVEQANAQVNLANATLTPIAPTLTAAAGRIFNSSTQVALAQNAEQNAIQQVETAQAFVNGVQPTLDSAETQIAGVQPTLAAAETQIAGVEPTLDSAETRVAGVEPTLDAANTQIAGVEPTLSFVQAEIDTQAGIANALRLVRSSEQVLQTGNPDLAIALALEAYRLNPSLGETQRLLTEALPLTVRLTFPSVNAVEISPDERFIALATNDTVEIWDPQARVLLRTVTEVASPSAMAFSPNSQMLAVGRSNITLVDPGTGAVLRTLENSLALGTVTDIAISDDGTRVIAGGTRGIAAVWQTDTGEELTRFAEHSSAVTQVAFNRNNDAYSFDNHPRTPLVGVMRVNAPPYRQAPLTPYRGISPDGLTAYTGANGTGQFLTFWRSFTSQELRSFRRGNASSDYIDEIDFSRDGRYIVVHSESRDYYDRANSLYRITGRAVAIWSQETGEEISRMSIPQSDPTRWDVYSLAFSPDARFVAVGARLGQTNTVMLFNAANGEEIRRFTGHPAPITDVRFSNGQRYILSADSQNNVRVWDAAVDDINIQLRIVPRQNSLGQMGLSADGTQLYLSFDNQSLGTWDTLSGNEVSGRRFLTNAQQIIAYNPLRPLAFVVNAQTALMWNMETRQFLYDLSSIEPCIRPGQVTNARFTSDGAILLVATSQCGLIEWDVENGQTIFTHSRIRSVRDMALSSNNEILAYTNGGNVTVYDLITRQTTHTISGFDATISGIDYSPIGNNIVIALSDPANTVLLYELRRGLDTAVLLYTFIGHTASVNDVAFSLDSFKILSGDENGTLILWDTQTGQVIREYNEHTAPIEQILFSPSGGLAYTRSTLIEEGVIGWRIESASDTVRRAYETRYIAIFSCQQRAQFNIQPPCENDGIPPTALPTPSPVATATPQPTETPRPSPTPTFTPTPSAVIQTQGGSRASLRSGAGEGFSRITFIEPGTLVAVLEIRSDIGWARIRLANGTEGWVSISVLDD